jgi:hypothetical protein
VCRWRGVGEEMEGEVDELNEVDEVNEVDRGRCWGWGCISPHDRGRSLDQVRRRRGFPFLSLG